MNQSVVNNAAPVQVTQTTVPPATPQKSPRPAVDLYVMSFCPYGVQAETAMKPVVALLGTKADFRVGYIATVKNSTVEGIRSLHGIEEAKEDLRQLCVMKYYPEKFWSYIEGINAQCYPGSREPAVLDKCWRNVSVPLGIDAEKVTSCSYSSEGISMIKDDERITTEKKITGSPTLLINGQRYAGQRSAEAYKLAICNAFETPPVECNTILSTQQAGQAAGACG
jgi:glutaredoxin